jgi:CheY-like chemotaxis protein/signal transduction histidine kinase/CHASE3 domain sensor protein
MPAITINEKKFRKTLLLNLLMPLALAVVLSGIYIGLLNYLLAVNRWVDHTDLVISQSNLLLKLIIDSETGMRGYAVTGNEVFLEPYILGTRGFAPQAKKLREMTVDNPAEVRRVEEITARFDEWRKNAQSIIDGRRAHTALDYEKLQLEGKDCMDAIRVVFQNLLTDEENLRNERAAQVHGTVKFFLVLIVFLSAALGALLALFGRKNLMSLSTSFRVLLENEVAQTQALTEQAWVKSGLVAVNEQLRGGKSVSQLSSDVLRALADYLAAKVGAIYLTDHEQVVKRVATYAFPAAAVAPPAVFNVGESLVGQVVRDKKIQTLVELPRDYITISSGLGETAPTTLTLVPLVSDGLVRGVVELGFLGADSAKQAARRDGVLAGISETIAVAIKAAQSRERLEQLLAETQRQAEELQAQQEELRVSNEELESQTSALKATQKVQENQQVELEATNAQLEEQAAALERQKNDLDRKNENLSVFTAELNEKADELLKANKYKSQFLANMSHELRTPLNSSLILAKLLTDNQGGNLTPQQVEFARTIYAAGNDLLNLINDILDLSKVEAGHLEVNPERIEIESLVKRLKSHFDPVAQVKNLEFVTEVSKTAASSFVSDHQRLEQILKNLLSNAFKFTSEGKVTLRLSQTADGHWRFEVQDTGIGIAKDSQSIIFEAFRQADGTTNRKFGGTGLGLSICRELARLLGGMVTLTSEPDHGSTFTLTLPADYTGERKETRPEIKKLAPPTKLTPIPSVTPAVEKPEPSWDDRLVINSGDRVLLVVEDDEKFARILFGLAHELKFKAVVASSAFTGLRAARELKPQGIILDVKLPDGSGLTLLDELKMDGHTRHIPVHVISGSDYSERALQMGAVGHLLKPAGIDQLREAFNVLESNMKDKVKQILIVEDDAFQRQAMKHLLVMDGVQVTAVENAGSALAELKSNRFDCVVMDLSLPDMSGYQMLESLSNVKGFSLPPVIVYTGRNLSRDEEMQLKKHSRSVVIKGAKSPERLLEEVTLFLHQVESRLPKDRQAMLQDLRHRETVFEAKTILVVDDDARNIFALTSVLEQKGAKIEVARNGVEALAAVRDNARIDLILMDIMMPEMNGLEAIREIRKNPKFSKLPIIAVTAKAMKDDQEQVIEAGANDYLPKPIPIERLLALIRVWLPRTVKG